MNLYKCPICGNVIEKIEDKNVPVFCCGKPMKALKANTTDGALEKHVPVVTYENGILHVEVGSVEHPSIPEHYITAIFVKVGNLTMRQDLIAGFKPEANFYVKEFSGVVEVFEYCNLHGLWKTEINI